MRGSRDYKSGKGERALGTENRRGRKEETFSSPKSYDESSWNKDASWQNSPGKIRDPKVPSKRKET